MDDNVRIDEQPIHENEEAVGATAEAQDDLSKALTQVEEFKQALQRERADFQNFRKRVDRENEGLKDKVRGDVLVKFLPILDDFERALQAVPAEEKQQGWMSGINLIHRKFQTLVEGEGIKTIDPLGEPFDPNFHEAIGTDEPTAEIQSGHVTAVLQKGFVQGDKILRPAMVRVAS